MNSLEDRKATAKLISGFYLSFSSYKYGFFHIRNQFSFELPLVTNQSFENIELTLVWVISVKITFFKFVSVAITPAIPSAPRFGSHEAFITSNPGNFSMVNVHSCKFNRLRPIVNFLSLSGCTRNSIQFSEYS